MSLGLRWMRADAPYMPIATVGLLSVLRAAGHRAAAGWGARGEDAVLCIAVDLDVEAVAQAIVDAPWPQVDRIAWGGVPHTQGLKPALKDTGAPLQTLRRLTEESREPERSFLRAVLTAGALDGDGVPQRSRLLRPVKADLSGLAQRPKKLTVAGIASELVDGPEFRNRLTGPGFVPEVQTFGGTTGPEPSSIGAFSPLLFLLLWHGILALPPVTVARGPRRSVGGPLVTESDVLSWPRWRYPASLATLRSLLCWSALHAPTPPRDLLLARDVDRVYRAQAVSLSTMVAVYRWGEQVM